MKMFFQMTEFIGIALSELVLQMLKGQGSD